MLAAPPVLPIRQLRILVRVPHRRHPVRGHAHRLQLLLNLFHAARAGPRSNSRLQIILRRQPPLHRCVTRISRQLPVLGYRARQRPPLLVARRRNRAPAILAHAAEHPVRRIAQIAVAQRRLHSLCIERVDQRRIQHQRRRLQLRYVDVLPFARAPPMIQRRQQRDDRHVRRDPVRVRHACADRLAIRPARQPRDARCRLQCQPEPPKARVRSRLPLHRH